MTHTLKSTPRIQNHFSCRKNMTISCWCVFAYKKSKLGALSLDHLCGLITLHTWWNHALIYCEFINLLLDISLVIRVLSHLQPLCRIIESRLILKPQLSCLVLLFLSLVEGRGREKGVRYKAGTLSTYAKTTQVYLHAIAIFFAAQGLIMVVVPILITDRQLQLLQIWWSLMPKHKLEQSDMWQSCLQWVWLQCIMSHYWVVLGIPVKNALWVGM